MKLPFPDKYSSRRRLLTGILVFICLWPMNTALSSIRIFSLVVTPQRILIPILFLFSVSTESRCWVTTGEIFDWRTLFFFWLYWSAIMAFLGGYSNHADASKEILGIILSFMVVSVLHAQIKTVDDYLGVLTLIKWIYIATILFGLIEVFTGFHLSTSAHHVLPGYSKDWLQPTAQFYGINDYSAYLAFFSPILFYRVEKRLSKLLSFALFTCILFMMVRNDAVISIIGTMIGVTVVFWLCGGKSPLTRRLIVLAAVTVMVLALLGWLSFSTTGGGPLPSALRRLQSEFASYKSGTGSMHVRLSMYREMVKIMLDHMFLGYGPASLLQVVKARGISLPLINPHNYHLELIFSYGLPLYLLLVYNYVRIVKTNTRLYRQTGQKASAFIVASCFILPIISMAPSGFIGYLYPWPIFALGVVVRDPVSYSSPGTIGINEGRGLTSRLS